MTEQSDKPASGRFQQVESEERLKLLEDEVALLSSALYEIQSSKAWKSISFYRRAGSKILSFFYTLQFVRYIWSYPGGFGSLINKVIEALNRGGWQGLKTSMQQYEQSRKQSLPTEIDHSLTISVAERRPSAILFISHEATRTGAPIFLLNLIRFVTTHLETKAIILLRVGGDLEQEFKKLGSVIRLENPNKLDGTVLSILRNNNIKLVYSNTITNGAIQSQLRSLDCPVVCHVHELPFSIETAFGSDNLDWIRKTTSLFLAGSQAVANGLSYQRGVPSDKIVVAYPFIDIQKNLDLANGTTPIRDIPSSSVVIGACGTLTWRKSPEVFLQVAQSVLRIVDQPVAFVWVGGTPLQNDYARLSYDTKTMGIEKNIFFTGNVPSHIQYLAQFDIFVLPSREDPFPLVVLDAATLGKPTVCFDKAGGAPEFVETDAGIIVPYLDIESMSDAIVTLINDIDLRKKMGARAREKAAGYDISTGGMKILDIIQKALVANLEEPIQ